MLNREQKEAAKPDDGITLVLAGPGTGKTKTLVAKVRNLLASGKYMAGEILVLTFSQQAAQEMRERIMRSIHNRETIRCTTFHSFCYSFLSTHKTIFLKETGYKKLPLVIDTAEKDTLIYTTIGKYMEEFLGLPVPIVAELITNHRFYENSKQKLYRLGLDTSLHKVREEYSRYKTKHALIEFEDMINISIQILMRYFSVRKKMYHQYKYIIVDEYQDTARNNFQFIQLLMHPSQPNLYVTGDDFQAIYAFRGTDPKYILHFNDYFMHIKKVTLYKNYRSTKEIVKISNKFIRHNRKQTVKKLESVKGRGGLVKGYPVSLYSQEMYTLYMLIKSENNHTNNIVVLYRNNFQGDGIKRIFQENKWQNYLGKVRLMTMHSSKGLEFDSVIITGVSDAIIPSPDADSEEERRVMYVALTRARSRLHIIYYIHENHGKAQFARELGL